LAGIGATGALLLKRLAQERGFGTEIPRAVPVLPTKDGKTKNSGRACAAAIFGRFAVFYVKLPMTVSPALHAS